MKLVVAIVQNQDAPVLIEELNKKGHKVTRLASTGGFLRAGNTTLLIGVEKEKVDDVVEIIDSKCKTRNIVTSFNSLSLHQDAYIPYPFEVKVGGATIFILDVERYERL